MVEITPIKVGRRANDGLGDDLRTASVKSNSNFEAVRAAVSDIRSAASGAVSASADATATATAAAGAAAAAVAALAGKSTIGHTPAPDADYQALVTDVQIGFAALSATRSVTLPDVDAYPIGQTLFVADESGMCSSTRRIRILPGPGTGDTIAGLRDSNGQPDAYELADAYQGIGFRRGAANVWIVAR